MSSKGTSPGECGIRHVRAVAPCDAAVVVWLNLLGVRWWLQPGKRRWGQGLGAMAVVGSDSLNP
mgnify:CR=1 FL=1